MLNRENKINYISRETIISSENLNNIQESILQNSDDIDVINSQLENIANEIENKTNINDNLISTESVWSSSKTQEMIQQIPKGDAGVTPNITIGEVTTLEPNQNAIVEITGTTENPILNFGIPKGEDGIGVDAVGKDWRLIREIVLEEDVTTINIDTDMEGLPFELSELYIFSQAWTNNENGCGFIIKVNDKKHTHGKALKNTLTRIIYSRFSLVDGIITNEYSQHGGTSNIPLHRFGYQDSMKNIPSLQSFNTISFSVDTSGYLLLTGSHFKIYGR